jgi:hypothetical protein
MARVRAVLALVALLLPALTVGHTVKHVVVLMMENRCVMQTQSHTHAHTHTHTHTRVTMCAP